MEDKLDTILYCNIATVCADGSPWNTPMFFVRNDRVLYWWSPLQTVHSQNILRDSRVFITVFNTQIRIEDGDRAALYLKCKAGLVDENEISDVIARFNDRVKVADFFLTPEVVQDKSPSRLFKAEILEAWENTSDTSSGYFVDIRDPVSLL